MNKLSFDQIHFLTILSDGRAKSWDQFMRDAHRPIMPMSQMTVERLARGLCEQGLVKSTFAGYKITDAGLDVLKEEALEIARGVLGRAAVEKMGMSKDEALETLRRSFRR